MTSIRRARQGLILCRTCVGASLPRQREEQHQEQQQQQQQQQQARAHQHSFPYAVLLKMKVGLHCRQSWMQYACDIKFGSQFFTPVGQGGQWGAGGARSFPFSQPPIDTQL